jgi:hypothetical protein
LFAAEGEPVVYCNEQRHRSSSKKWIAAGQPVVSRPTVGRIA